MNELIVSMMIWISSTTGWQIPDPPEILFLSIVELKSYAYGCDLKPIPKENEDICAAKEFWEYDSGAPLGLYDHIDKKIVLNKNFNIESVKDKSILFHELVHHLQYENELDKTAPCRAKLEKEAYDLQNQWLKEKYNTNVFDTIEMNEMFYYVITECRDMLY